LTDLYSFFPFLSCQQYIYTTHTYIISQINMVLLLTIIIVFLLLLLIIVNYVWSLLARHAQLQKDYRSVSFLPISTIPFVGNLHLIDRQPPVFFQLLCRLSKECQKKDKGVFCLWYAVWPMTFICSANGLEVWIFYFL
jgi:hypothetical protein